MGFKGLLTNLAEWLDDRGLLRPQTGWVLGVSGGPDSTLLARALCELNRTRDLGWRLHVAHLHHGLRGRAADEDARFVEELARTLGLPVTVERADVAGEAARGGGSLEEVGRRRRYAFLERVALSTGSEYVAVAHHADDDAETVLHRIFRGTGLRGLAGMPAVRPIQPGSRVQLVRPFLHLRRRELERVAEEIGLPWRIDESNASSAFTRNRIRNEVIPLLEARINPHVTDAVLRLAEQARWLNTYLEDAAGRTYESLVITEGPGQVVLNIRGLLAKQRIIQAEVLRRAISLVVGREQDLGFAHIEAVLRLAAQAASGKEIHLPGQVTARKVYERLELRTPQAEPQPAELVPVMLECPGRTPLPQLGLELTAEICEIDAEKVGELRRAHSPYEVERVRFPLMVRGRREGDRFRPLGSPGSKSVGEFFTELKIDPALRARVGIVCDQQGPVWIMPLRIDERVKLRPTTRQALHLVLRPLDRAQSAP